MNSQEKIAVTILSSIISLRLLGIFLVLPIFSSYIISYPGATPALAGLAFGIYPLIQSLLQLPFGWISDRWGRKRMLMIGLFLNSLGGFLCWRVETIGEFILARMVQGSGSVSAVTMAAMSDFTRPEVRARSFTILGIFIGTTFTLGILGGPYLARFIGLKGLFFILGMLGALAMVMVLILLPQIPRTSLRAPLPIRKMLTSPEIRKLYAASFNLAFLLNLFFLIYPLDLGTQGVPRGELWKIYLVIFTPTLILVYPFIHVSEKGNRLHLVERFGWGIMATGIMAYLAFFLHRSIVLYIAGAAFFLGYSMFQPLLPTFLTRRTPNTSTGTATGFYNLFGFLGSSAGGILGGILYNLRPVYPLVLSLAILLGWGIWGLPAPPEGNVKHDF